MVVSVLIVVFSGVIIAATDSLGAFTWPPSETSILVTSEVGIATAATVATVAILTSLVRYLSERRLQYIGFTATVLAILTQFVPPVLDLLNIPVR
jgi:hypothetical protein